MVNTLIIGLNNLSKKIILSLKSTKFEVNGFDFDVDKINLYNKENLISNSSSILLNDLLKMADIIILNIEYSKYETIFRFLPFIKSDCLIINTNTYKGNINIIRERLQNRVNNFIPCNFLLFPSVVIMNYDADTKMNFILKTSNFFKDIKIKTSVLEPSENNKIFDKLCYIPFLFEKILFKNTNYPFMFSKTDYMGSKLFIEDIILNKKSISSDIENFINNLPNFKNTTSILDFFDNNNLEYTKSKEDIKSDINEEIILKILVEKTFIKTFIHRDLEYYINLIYLDFNYIKYDAEVVKEYYLENKQNIEMSAIILKEKIINLISFIRLDNLSVNKLEKFINNI